MHSSLKKDTTHTKSALSDDILFRASGWSRIRGKESYMKASKILAVLFTCVLAAPVFGQQKTYDWVPGNDETVRLDPGYYYTGAVYQSGGGTRTFHVDIDAQRPVTLAMVAVQDWTDADQHPETRGNLNFMCVRQHVMQATYTCDLPWGVPARLLVRDERGDRGFAGMGMLTAGRDHDRQQAPPPGNDAYDARRGDRDRRDFDRDRDRRFSYPNDVHIGYYDWSCTANCSLPDPPRQKLFDWVPTRTYVHRLDPGEFFHGDQVEFGTRNVGFHYGLAARWPVTVAVVPAGDWNDALAHRFGRNLDNLNYYCIQRHVVSPITFDCKLDVAMAPLFLVVLDERAPLPADQYARSGGQNPAQPNSPANQPPARPGAPAIAQNPHAKLGQPANQSPAQQQLGPVERTLAETQIGQSTPQAVGVAFPGTAGSMSRPFLAPNEIRRLGYEWRCVDACDQPDYAWAFQLNESYAPTNVVRLYGAAVIPDHDGEQVSIRVKSPVPMAVAMVRAKGASRLYSAPDTFESIIGSSPCMQRGVQDSTFNCTFNLADGPQALVLLPEAGADIPPHKKVDVALQANKCVDNCRGPSYSWVSQAEEKYRLTPVLKMYGGITADRDSTTVSIKIKSPVPMTAVMVPSSQAGRLYGKPDLLDAAIKSSSCEQQNVQDSTFQCVLDVADGPQSLVVLPNPGQAIPKDKKAEVHIQALKCVDKCN
jgi:hypothetical protein